MLSQYNLIIFNIWNGVIGLSVFKQLHIVFIASQL